MILRYQRLLYQLIPVGDDTRSRDYKNRDRSIRHDFREQNEKIVRSLFSDSKKVDSGLLNENNLLDDNL